MNKHESTASLVELVYVSVASVDFTHQDLIEILKIARKNNYLNDISGLLLYNNKGNFIQAIEGPEKAINLLFDKIKQDQRHDQVYQLAYRPISKRCFADWQMGFKLLDDVPMPEVQGFSEFMHQDANINHFVEHKNFALELLDYFRKTNTN
ncbi:MAG: BLUF domain-containing protein [Paraglaciecola sp.]|uniref:BLUF domain-containing protein n=1 Tax=Paraglaciecola sp. TaxID=1920173 RepID=UPI00273DCDA6|nr:BLUF domain-containing protein [Paraglaciecola sp.]MDP5030770.1 BLUF domain-containing protein [Paraglaciecola sp.]MDP5132166.1 BLUF domain-containing protein [Paraglaciecola sp.]